MVCGREDGGRGRRGRREKGEARAYPRALSNEALDGAIQNRNLDVAGLLLRMRRGRGRKAEKERREGWQKGKREKGGRRRRRRERRREKGGERNDRKIRQKISFL
jgi:hypothetical protein